MARRPRVGLPILALATLVASLSCGQTAEDAQGSGGSPSSGGAATSGGPAQGGSTGVGSGPSLTMLAQFERVRGFGFCIEEGMFRQAQIVVDPTSGDWLFSGTIFRGADAEETVAPRALLGAERADFAASFRALLRPECGGVYLGACDPCLVTRLELDGTAYADPACRADTCPGYREAFRALTAKLDSLAQ